MLRKINIKIMVVIICSAALSLYGVVGASGGEGVESGTSDLSLLIALFSLGVSIGSSWLLWSRQKKWDIDKHCLNMYIDFMNSFHKLYYEIKQIKSITKDDSFVLLHKVHNKTAALSILLKDRKEAQVIVDEIGDALCDMIEFLEKGGTKKEFKELEKTLLIKAALLSDGLEQIIN